MILEHLEESCQRVFYISLVGACIGSCMTWKHPKTPYIVIPLDGMRIPLYSIIIGFSSIHICLYNISLKVHPKTLRHIDGEAPHCDPFTTT